MTELQGKGFYVLGVAGKDLPEGLPLKESKAA